jgi:hypothetical protein
MQEQAKTSLMLPWTFFLYNFIFPDVLSLKCFFLLQEHVYWYTPIEVLVMQYKQVVPNSIKYLSTVAICMYSIVQWKLSLLKS